MRSVLLKCRFRMAVLVGVSACGSSGGGEQVVDEDAGRPDSMDDGGSSSYDGGGGGDSGSGYHTVTFDGGSAEVLSGWKLEKLGFGLPAAFAVSEDRLYWLEQPEVPHPITELRIATLPGGTDETRAEVPQNTIALTLLDDQPYILTTDRRILAWSSSFQRLELVSSLTFGLSTELQTDGTQLYVITNDGTWQVDVSSAARALIEEANYGRAGRSGYYWVSDDNMLTRYADGRVSEVAPVPGPLLGSIVEHDEYLYFLLDDLLSERVPTDGLYRYRLGDPQVVMLAESTGRGPLVIIGDYVYWCEREHLRYVVYRVHLDGGDKETVVATDTDLFASSLTTWGGGPILGSRQGFLWLHPE